jgi:hypothetical protein
MMLRFATRYYVQDAKVGMEEVERAKAMWTKAGAKAFRSYQFFTGAFVGQWLFHIDFDDMAHLQKARSTVMSSTDMATINANNAKAGNKMVGREILMGLSAT